jgi:uncharacterized RDD family membrane protein YckC
VATPVTSSSSGIGSVAGFGSRLVAFIIDAALANVVALIIDGGYHRGERQSLVIAVAFLLIELIFVAFVGQTPGMRVAGIGVIRYGGDGGRAPLRWVALRTVLLATVILGLFTDSSGRAMHDRAAGTVMIRTR